MNTDRDLITIRELPHDMTVHALFVGYQPATDSYVFEVTRRGTLLLPKHMVERGDCGKFQKGEDLLLTRDRYRLYIKRPEREARL